MYKPRTHLLPKLMNSEVAEYLQHNDMIFVPVGTVEMHGGLPLDCETVVSEAFASRMAETVNGLALTGLPYFYAGATASGRGTVQVSVRQGIDYLHAIAHSLLRQGFKRQVYISFHGPAHMTCSPMVRDFFDETGVPILYMDLTMQMFKNARDLFKSIDTFNSILIAGYDIMGRLEDVPLTTGFSHNEPQSVAPFNGLFEQAYQSGSVGYCFGDPKDHTPTPEIPTAERRLELANEGRPIIETIVERMHLPKMMEDLRDLRQFEEAQMEKYPWMPAAYNNR